MVRRIKATGYSPYARHRIPAPIVHGWAIRDDLLADTARLCRAPLSLVRDPGDLAPNTEPEAFQARRITALVLRHLGVPLETIGQMLDRDRTSVRSTMSKASAWDTQAAEQLALKYAPQEVAS